MNVIFLKLGCYFIEARHMAPCPYCPEPGSLEKVLQSLLKVKDSRPEVGTMTDLIRYLELKNMLFVGEAVCRSALERTETRGSHFRADFPEEDDANWMVNIQVRLLEDRDLLLRKIPVS